MWSNDFLICKEASFKNTEAANFEITSCGPYMQ